MVAVIAETIETLKRKYPGSLQEVWIDDLVIGIFFTGVKLSTGHAGVAFTPAGEIPEAVCCPTTAARMPKAGNLDGKAASTLIDDCLEANVLKSALGVATLNALSQRILASSDLTGYQMVKDADGFDLLNIQPRERVCLIGAFGPYIRRLKGMENPFYVLERNPQTLRPEELKYFRPQSQTKPTLEESDVVIMTGTAIVNHTIDSLLSSVPKGIRIGIIGPTASMLPDAFFARGVQVMAGIRILDPDRMIRILKQGGSGYHLLQECSEKIAFRKISGKKN
jgi:uncharacterized protein (DUF4213/DUF364 family)